MSHQIFIAPDWNSAETWLLDRLCLWVRENPLLRARVVLPSGTLVRHLEERLLACGVEGFFGPLLSTLSDLLQEILEESAPEGRAGRIPAALRLWGLARLVRREVPEEGPMGQVRELPGFVAATDVLIRELQEAGIEPEALLWVGEARGSSKLRELGRIYEAYRQMLQAQGWTDAGGEEAAAAAAIRSSGALPGFDPLILYGFDEFSSARFEVIQALLESHPGVVFLLLFDPERREAFSSVEWSLKRLQELTGASPRTLPAAASGDSALSFVRRRVFSASSARIEADDSLQLLTASGPAQMIETIARELRRLRYRDAGLNWGDCAVVLRNLSAYRHLVREIFPRFDIPYDLPAGTPWREIRILSFLRRILELKSGGFPRESLLECLHSAHCRVRLPPQSVDLLAAVLPSHVPPQTLAAHLGRLAKGRAREAEEPTEEAEAPGARREGVAALEEAAREVGALECVSQLAERATCSEYAAQIEGIVRSLIYVPELGENTLLSDAHSIAWERRALGEWLHRLRALGTAWPGEISFEEFLLLLSFLAQEEVLSPPSPRTDAVVFHDPLRARGLSFRVVVVAALLEKEFPASVRPGPFLREAEREALLARAGSGAHLSSQAERLAKERLLFVCALEAARERLYLAYADTDTQGRPSVVSPFVEEVRAFVAPDRGPGLQTAAAYTPADVLPPHPAHLWYAEEAAAWTLDRLYQEGQLDPEGAAVLSHFLRRGQPPGLAAELSRWYEREFTAFDGELGGREALVEELRRRWAGRPLSPTRLDSYGQCPWQFFASHILELAAPEREEVEISPLDRGRLFHRILERFYRQRREGPRGRVRPLAPEEEAAVLDTIHRIAEEECDQLREEGRTGHPGAWGYEKERLRIRLEWFIRSEIEYFKHNPGVAPARLEFSFGMRERRGKDPASTEKPLLLSRGGVEVRVRGIIDRVDLSSEGKAWVIDYKTGASAPTYSALAGGTSFQLFAYLLAVRQLLDLEPAAGFYLMLARPPGAKGKLSQVGRINCGERPARRQRSWAELQERLMDFLQAYAADIQAGHFPLLPVSAEAQREPCRHCDFRHLCRVDEVRLMQGKREAASRFARTRVREEG